MSRDGLPPHVQRRVRLARAAALGGLLAASAAPVWLRAATAPAPGRALNAVRLSGPTEIGPTGPGPSPRASGTPVPTGRRTVTGAAVDAQYGMVQVRVVLVGTRLVDVRAVTLPSGGRSSDISSYAAPLLRREALLAQAADIDTVSGASYTSAGYARSLQSALDRAGRG